jgi:hypothetical protein
MNQNNFNHSKEKVTFDSLPYLVLKLTEDVSFMQRSITELSQNFQPQEPEEYLTRDEVSKLFKVDLSTIHNWTKKGILKPYYKGNKVYYLKSELKPNGK